MNPTLSKIPSGLHFVHFRCSQADNQISHHTIETKCGRNSGNPSTWEADTGGSALTSSKLCYMQYSLKILHTQTHILTYKYKHT